MGGAQSKPSGAALVASDAPSTSPWRAGSSVPLSSAERGTDGGADPDDGDGDASSAANAAHRRERREPANSPTADARAPSHDRASPTGAAAAASDDSVSAAERALADIEAALARAGDEVERLERYARGEATSGDANGADPRTPECVRRDDDDDSNSNNGSGGGGGGMGSDRGATDTADTAAGGVASIGAAPSPMSFVPPMFDFGGDGAAEVGTRGSSHVDCVDSSRENDDSGNDDDDIGHSTNNSNSRPRSEGVRHDADRALNRRNHQAARSVAAAAAARTTVDTAPATTSASSSLPPSLPPPPFRGSPAESAALLAAADAEHATAVSGAATWRRAADRFRHACPYADRPRSPRDDLWRFCRARFRPLDRTRKQATALDERLTRSILAADAVQGVSRGAVREALRANRRSEAKRVSALMSRRKRVVQGGEALAQRAARAARDIGVASSVVRDAASQVATPGATSGDDDADDRAGDGGDDDHSGEASQRDGRVSSSSPTSLSAPGRSAHDALDR